MRNPAVALKPTRRIQLIKGLNLELYYHEQSPAIQAPMVPSGLAPKGRYAPTREVDGDDGQAAAARGQAMGIDGLVFVTAAPPRPLIFANALITNGRPTLHYAVIGGDKRVAVTINGKTHKLEGSVGSVPIDGGPGLVRATVASGNVHIEKQVRLPIKP